MNVLMWSLAVLPLGAVPEETVNRFEAQSVQFTGGEYENETFNYRLLKPENIEEGKKYPVVLFLHGAGERGDNNTAQLQYLPEWISEPENRKKYPCFLIAPQCRTNKKWANVNWGEKDSSPQPDMSEQMQVALKILKTVTEKYPVDTQRVYLTGLSMGGYGSWDLACRQPEMFAAVAPVCGGGDERQAAKLVGVPVWAWHGDADPAVPVERSRKMIEAIKKAGGMPKYTELPKVGHNSWVQAYHGPENLLPWMFEQVNNRQAK